MNSLCRLLAAVLILTSSLGALPAAAGSPILHELASLTQVELHANTGLNFDPIPGLDLEELERKLLKVASRTLTENDIAVEPRSESDLYISVDKELVECDTAGYYVFSVRVELIELAELKRHAGVKDGPGEIEVTTWQEMYLVKSTSALAGDRITSIVEIVFETFANEVNAARRYAEREEMEKTADDL